MIFDDDEDDRIRVRMGRFSDADERIVQGIFGKRFRSALRPKSRSARLKNKAGTKRNPALPSRATVIERGYGFSTGKEAIVKARSCPKSDHSVMTLLRYVARIRPEDERNGRYGFVPLWDGFGKSLSVGDIQAIREGWDLAPDQDNLSPTARTHLKNGDLAALRAMEGRERLQHIQAWHFVLSIEEDGAEEAVRCKFQRAAHTTVDEIFTARGHKTVWAVHQGHTDHIHAHVVVRALSDFGGRLHSDIHGDYLYALRRCFAEKLSITGLDYKATRRIDRQPQRERILAGHDPLQNDRCPWRQGKADNDPYAGLATWPHHFGGRAMWNMERLEWGKMVARAAAKEAQSQDAVAVAVQALRQRLDVPPPRPSWLGRAYTAVRRRADNDEVPKPYQELFERLKEMYHDPLEALRSWHFMAIDGAYVSSSGKTHHPNRRLANWTLRYRPEYLGCVKADAYQMVDDKRFRKCLRKSFMSNAQPAPAAPGGVSDFANHRKQKRVQQDRSKVVTELKRLVWHYQEDWPGAWYAEITENAVRQSRWVEIGQKLPEIKTLAEIKSEGEKLQISTKQPTFPGSDRGNPESDRIFQAEEFEVEQGEIKTQKLTAREKRNVSRG